MSARFRIMLILDGEGYNVHSAAKLKARPGYSKESIVNELTEELINRSDMVEYLINTAAEECSKQAIKLQTDFQYRKGADGNYVKRPACGSTSSEDVCACGCEATSPCMDFDCPHERGS